MGVSLDISVCDFIWYLWTVLWGYKVQWRTLTWNTWS